MNDAERLIAAWRREYGQSFAAVESAIRADEQVNALEFCCADTEPDLRRKIAEELRALAEQARTAPRGVLTSIETQAAVLHLAAERVEQGAP